MKINIRNGTTILTAETAREGFVLHYETLRLWINSLSPDEYMELARKCLKPRLEA